MNIRQTPKSSTIVSLAYKAGEMFVTFKSGSTYRYRNVPSWLYAVLFRAKSMGRAFAKHVRNNPAIPFERVA